MVFDGLKPMSMKLAILLLAGVILVFGTSWFKNTGAVNYAPSTIMFIVGFILLLEVGLKIATPLSSLKKFGIIQYISLGIAVILVIGAIIAIPIVNIEAGTTINTLTNFGVGIGAIFIAAEALL